MKLGEVVKKGPFGALQGPSKGPQMTKIAENGQNNESFVVVSSQMLLGRKILGRDTVTWYRKTKYKIRGPSGTYSRGPH